MHCRDLNNEMRKIKQNDVFKKVNDNEKVSEEAGGVNVVDFMVTFFRPVLFFCVG